MDNSTQVLTRPNAPRQQSRKLLRSILDDVTFESIFPRQPGKAGPKGIRNRRILRSTIHPGGGRTDFHATKGPRHYAHA